MVVSLIYTRSIPIPIQKDVQYILSKVDRDITPTQLVAELGYTLKFTDDTWGAAGYYNHKNKIIAIDNYWKHYEYDVWDILSHEIGHLIYYEISDTHDVIKDVYRDNCLFSTILADEQLASLVGGKIFNWRFPQLVTPEPSFFDDESIQFLMHWCDGIAENDVKIDKGE